MADCPANYTCGPMSAALAVADNLPAQVNSATPFGGCTLANGNAGNVYGTYNSKADPHSIATGYYVCTAGDQTDAIVATRQLNVDAIAKYTPIIDPNRTDFPGLCYMSGPDAVCAYSGTVENLNFINVYTPIGGNAKK